MKTLYISAGHSDVQPGAVANGKQENKVVLEFRDLVANELRKLDCIFGTDGVEGQNLTLNESANTAKNYDLAVEFHLNAGPATATGVETLSAPKDYALCNEICSIISDSLNIKNRGAKPEDSGQHKRLAFVQAGGIIVELFFITNKQDLSKYEQNKLKLAKEVADVLYKASQR